MNQSHYDQLSQEAWDQAYREYQQRKRYVTPDSITFEQAKAQFNAIARSALHTLVGRYGNNVREQQQLSKLHQPPIPKSIAQWIDKSIDNVDSSFGNPGATP
ncbi:MAG: hypothetical protein DM484_18970 [Candidatus Methylumidiphilus alinenensis]|uniref:Uncharacterized protein n=1 Tax=Candidatus Methylumidiphilus alinenensis TaxID=2202197 RepID=A0A2W4SXX7_9GAMM|nr:MAG: hypothetical protein DM484_18970 [Candidatus Methylumidiphilus alinenensis]